jgi:hypothetical protein
VLAAAAAVRQIEQPNPARVPCSAEASGAFLQIRAAPCGPAPVTRSGVSATTPMSNPIGFWSIFTGSKKTNLSKINLECCNYQLCSNSSLDEILKCTNFLNISFSSETWKLFHTPNSIHSECVNHTVKSLVHYRISVYVQVMHFELYDLQKR